MSLSYKCETALYHQVPSLNLVFKVLRGSFKLFLFSWIETHHLIPSAMMQMKQVSFPAGKCWQDRDNDQRSGKRKYPNSPGYYSVSQRCRNLGVVLGQNLSRDDTYWFSGSIQLPPLQKQETRVRSFLSSKIWKLLFTSSSPVGLAFVILCCLASGKKKKKKKKKKKSPSHLQLIQKLRCQDFDSSW